MGKNLIEVSLDELVNGERAIDALRIAKRLIDLYGQFDITLAVNENSRLYDQINDAEYEFHTALKEVDLS